MTVDTGAADIRKLPGQSNLSDAASFGQSQDKREIAPPLNVVAGQIYLLDPVTIHQRLSWQDCR